MTRFFFKNISLIIPTLNSSLNIRTILNNLKGIFFEIIVIDGQSSDDSYKIAKRYTRQVYTAEPGRGYQLSMGALKSKGEWLLFLHSDSLLNEECLLRINEFISSPTNKYKAAVFKLKINNSNIFARIIENLANIRTKIFSLPYGDQGLLISKEYYQKIGGYKKVKIMEDLDIIKKIGGKNLIILDAYIKTSSENYVRDGWIYRPLKNIICLTLFLFKIDTNTIYKFYYRSKN